MIQEASGAGRLVESKFLQGGRRPVYGEVRWVVRAHIQAKF